MRFLVPLSFILGIIIPYALIASQALMNVVDSSSANAALADYTNNVLRIEVASTNEWDASNPRKVLDLFPANMPYQLVVASAADRQAAEAAIACATNAMAPKVREMFFKARIMAPVLQGLFRHCRPGVMNEADYLTAKAHPTVWCAGDFDLAKIGAAAGRFTEGSVPVLTMLTPVYEEFETHPIRRAEPLLDYPDPRPEVTFETMFGIGIVLRAPEKRRKFRFQARSWPVQDEKVTFAWKVIPSQRWVSAKPFEGRGGAMAPKNGYAEFAFDWTAVGQRMDILVCARYGEGPYGPPAMISFFVIPNEKRTYDKSGFIEKIEYVKQDVVIPRLYQNKGWTDEYKVDPQGNILGFVRTKTGQFVGKEDYSVDGEFVHEFQAEDLPKVVSPVRYFTRTDDPGTLDYEILSDRKTLPFRAVEPRDRGEFFKGKKRRVPKKSKLE